MLNTLCAFPRVSSLVDFFFKKKNFNPPQIATSGFYIIILMTW